MRGIRSRQTYANVMVTILAFIVLGGGTAIGAIVVSDNNQVAANTISGHKPPTGKHANIIGGSVNGTDLATGAVTNGKIGTSAVTIGKLAGNSVNSAKIVDGSVMGADLNTGDVKSSLGMRSGSLFMLQSGTGTLYSHGNYSLSASCPTDGPTDGHAAISLESNSANPAFLAIEDSTGERFVGVAATLLAQTSASLTSQTRGADFSVQGVDGTYLQGRVQATYLDSTDSGQPANACKFTFYGLGD
jgi:hypothetical protein